MFSSASRHYPVPIDAPKPLFDWTLIWELPSLLMDVK